MKCTGLLTVKVDGDTIFAKAGQVELDVGGMERKEVDADGRILGYTEKPVPSKLTVTCQHTSDTDMRALADQSNVSCVVTLDSGVKYLIDGAFLSKPPVLSGENGDIKLEYIGQSAKQL